MLNCLYPGYKRENYHNSGRMIPPHYINNLPQWLKHKKYLPAFMKEVAFSTCSSFPRPLGKVNFRMHFNFLERHKKSNEKLCLFKKVCK